MATRPLLANVWRGLQEVAKLEVGQQMSLSHVSTQEVTIFHFSYRNRFLISDIKKQFTLSPLSARIEPGSKIEINCTPPPGVPQPQISWLKNNENMPTSSSSSVTITKEGNLIISQAKSQVRGLHDFRSTKIFYFHYFNFMWN